MAAPKLPQQFGPYTLRELIARGGMAEIFRATTAGVGGFEKTVAIKKILPHLAENDEFITMLIDEARIIVSINHANIAQVYDLGEIDEDYYIAMEYIHGIDLSTIAKELKEQNRTVPVEHALFIASGIAAGLHVAHNKCDEAGRPLNIVHRDVSPHNILISYAGDVKIIDFGVAKARGKEAHTQLGVIKGKLLYMAPEQAMAKELDGRADLFAMGLILYRMLTNHLPFEGDNEFQIYNHILSKEITPPRAFNPNIPEEVNQIAMMLLQRDPSKRYQDGYSAKVDLDRALQSVAPGYSISRLSRWVEDEFSHLIQRRMAQSGQNDVAPSTPSHNNLTGNGELRPPGWDQEWDEIDEDEDTINVAMDSPEAQRILEQAQRERARYRAMRATGEIESPGPAPWEQPQHGPQPGQVPQPQQSGQWEQPQPQAYQQQAPYGSGQYPSPAQPQQQWAGQSGQWQHGQPQQPALQSGNWPQPAPQQQYPVNQSGAYPVNQSGAYPVNQSGAYPVNQSGAYPVNQSGAYPVNQSGAYPVNQSGMYAAPNQSGQFPTPGPAGSGMYQSPHYQPFQGPSPLRPDGIPATETGAPSEDAGKSKSGLAPKIIVLVLMIGVVAFLGWQLFAGGDATEPAPDEQQVPVPEIDNEPATAEDPIAPAEDPAAAVDAGAAPKAENGRTVKFKAESEPKGADVYVNDKLLGQTPLEAPIPWGEEETLIRFELEGHATEEMEAIPFDDFRRSVELMPVSESDEPDPDPDPGTEKPTAKPPKSAKPDKPEKKAPPATRRPTKRRKPKPKVEPKTPSIPLLLEEKEEKKPEKDVPLF